MNPELRRYSWLELTPGRLFTIPLTTAGLIYLSFLSTRRPEVAYVAALALFWFHTQILGAGRAAAAVSEERSDKTWDTQKLSAISAWGMTWGKLFGSTLPSWYGAITGIVTLLFIPRALTFGKENGISLLLLIGSGLLVQLLAFTGSLDKPPGERTSSRRRSISGTLLPIILGTPFLSISIAPSFYTRSVYWYEGSYSASQFVAASLLVFVLWAVLGAWRLMRTELCYHSLPWAWPAFLVFLSFYGAGFITEKVTFHQPAAVLPLRLVQAFLIMLAGSYLMILRESKEPVRYRKMWSALRSHSWMRFAMLTPRWVISLLMAIVTAGWFSTLAHASLTFGQYQLAFQFIPFVCLAFFLRDALIFHAYHFASRTPARADTMIMVTLFLLYFVIPSLFLATSITSNVSWFYPMGFTVGANSFGSISDLFPPLIETALVLGLIVWRYRPATVTKQASKK